MQKKIHLLFRIRSMEIGGVQKVLLEYLKNIPKDVFEISLMVNLYQGELISEIPKDIRVYPIGKGKDILSKIKWIRILQLISRRIRLFFYDKFPLFLYKKLHSPPDIEIAFETSVFNSIINSPIKKSKKIGWLHIDLVNTNSDDKVNLKIIEIMKKFDACIIVSDFAKNNFKKYYNIEFPNALVINNPINTIEIQEKSEAFTPTLPKPAFVAAGRLTKGKGCYTLLYVHKKLIENGFKHYVFYLGDGPEKENITKEIKEFGLEDTFVLLGSQNNPYPYFKEADFFIHTSNRESYPMVILENMLLQKPIISTNVGGIPEMIESGKDGILVNCNEEEIYEAMKNFLTNPNLVSKIKEGTKNSKEKFDENKIYKQVITIFENLLINRDV